MHSSRALSLLTLALAFSLNVASAVEPETTPAAPIADVPLGMVEDPCAGLAPGTIDWSGKIDWAGLCRYRADNMALKTPPELELYGDSITEGWVRFAPELFGSRIIGRGISGQTTAQMLVRFQADVIALKPRRVQIMAGTNDVAGNQGPTSEQTWRNNILSMVQLARANGIEPVLASIPPAARFAWKPGMKPAAQIVRLNDWLREYARQQNLVYVDYYAVLVGEGGALKPQFGDDGVHPNVAGYAAMRTLMEGLLK